MEIKINKPVEKIIYKNHRTGKDEILEDGVIITQQDLISPMRQRFETGLSNKEPHVGFKNLDGVVFVPLKDIITLEYY